MINILLALALTCPEPKIVNNTNEWTDYDQATYNKALKRCGELYKDAPCLKLFTKKDKTSYTVVCGYNE